MQAYVEWGTKMKALSDKFSLLGLCELTGIHPREIGLADAVLFDNATQQKRCDALVMVAKALLFSYRMELSSTSTGFKVSPLESWRDSATRIMYTINGLGTFMFRGTNHFLESGPYTPRQAVLSHLHYVKEFSQVYGGPTPHELFNSTLNELLSGRV